MMAPEDLLRGSIYKSLETDDEFRTRVEQRYGGVYGLDRTTGDYLDDIVWTCFRVQRRIVERDIKPASGRGALRATR